MKRSSPSRVWMWFAITVVLYAGTWAASRRFPAAPLTQESADLPARLEALRGYDPRALVETRQRRDLTRASVVDAESGVHTRTRLAEEWQIQRLPARTLDGISVFALKLRSSGTSDWPALLRVIREVQALPGVSVSAASVSARGSVLSVELTAKLIAHSQPADDKASGLPAVVQVPQNR